MKRWIMGVLWTVFFCLAVPGTSEASSKIQETAPSPEMKVPEAMYMEFDSADIERYLKSLEDNQTGSISFDRIMKKVMSGDLFEVFKEFAAGIRASLSRELKANAGLMGQILMLAFAGAVFSGFSEIFGSGHVSETGFYVIYLLMMTLMAASFFASVSIADRVTGEILGFMKVLLPAYFLAVTMAGGTLTSTAVCGFTIGTIGMVQMVVTELLLPVVRISMMAALAGNLYREDMLSKLTELMRQGILWTMKIMFGVIVGFHIIQGMVIPQADALKNASVMKIAQLIPGLGNGAGAVYSLMMGSGVLIKNAAGVAAVAVLLILAAVPLMKLFLLMLLYYGAAAMIQPVCDKRLVACMTEAAAGHGILLKLVGYSLSLFAVTIAVLCVSTNAVWYAG